MAELFMEEVLGDALGEALARVRLGPVAPALDVTAFRELLVDALACAAVG